MWREMIYLGNKFETEAVIMGSYLRFHTWFMNVNYLHMQTNMII